MKLKQWPVIQWRLLPGLPSYSSTSYYSSLYPPAQPQLISSFVKPEKKPLVPSPEGRARLLLCIIRDNFIQNLYKVYVNQIKHQNI